MKIDQKLHTATITFAVLTGALTGIVTAPAMAAQTKVSYAPGITLVPEVMQPDGQTARTYQTPKGLSYWTNDLPVQQGDKIKLNVFAATGGSELKEAKVRLDNVSVADLTAVPWNTTLDTTTLSPGYHMVEVWAQGTGDRPQTSTKTFSFFVTKTLPAHYAVKGSQQVLDSTLMESHGPSADDSNALPTGLPAFLLDRTTTDTAGIVVHSDTAAIDAQFASGASSITLDQPTIIYVRSTAGSTATKYAYVLSRDGKTIVSSAAPASLSYQRIRLQGRTDTTPGLRSGPVTLFVWGIDRDGNLSTPTIIHLRIP